SLPDRATAPEGPWADSTASDRVIFEVMSVRRVGRTIPPIAPAVQSERGSPAANRESPCRVGASWVLSRILSFEGTSGGRPVASTARAPGPGSQEETMATRLAASDAFRRVGPEAALALLAGAVFLGFLGSVDLWGKREQRASAEAIDTVDHKHWLVAQIQGRPRLEKPPLPRLSIALLVIFTGRRDVGIVRLPGALAGVATVALIYLLGRLMGGR